MIPFHRRVLSLVLQSPPLLLASHNSPFVSLNRLFSATTPVAPNRFSAEDYLVATCGLTRAQALEASKKLSHLKSPAKPDAVLAFLAGLGLSRGDVAAIVAADPSFLCADAEKTLAPRIVVLSDLGLSRSEIARLVLIAKGHFRTRSLRRILGFWLSVFGSPVDFLQALITNHGLLTTDLEKVAKPNLVFLQQCGISASEIPHMNVFSCRLFTTNPKSLQEAVERVEELGLERGSPMFRRALALVAFKSKEDVARKLELFQKIGFSQDQTLVIMRKAPFVLGLSEENIRRTMHFLIRDVGLEAPYIAQRPVLLLYSLERRLLPRHWLLKVLREKGLLNIEGDYYRTAAMAERIFLKKFVHPFMHLVPGLADDYASRCSVKVPSGAALQEI